MLSSVSYCVAHAFWCIIKTWNCGNTKSCGHTWNILGMPGVPGACFEPTWPTLALLTSAKRPFWTSFHNASSIEQNTCGRDEGRGKKVGLSVSEGWGEGSSGVGWMALKKLFWSKWFCLISIFIKYKFPLCCYTFSAWSLSYCKVQYIVA